MYIYIYIYTFMRLVHSAHSHARGRGAHGPSRYDHAPETFRMTIYIYIERER